MLWSERELPATTEQGLQHPAIPSSFEKGLCQQFFPGGSDSKESPCDAGDMGLIPGSGRSPGGGPGNPLQQPPPGFLPGVFHGQRSLVGYSPWGCKQLDTTERLTLSLSFTEGEAFATCLSVSQREALQALCRRFTQFNENNPVK